MKMKISNIYTECFAQEGFIGNFHKKAVALHFGFVSDSRPNGRYASQNAKASGQPHHFFTLPSTSFFKMNSEQ